MIVSLIASAICTISSSFNPLDVTAGVPRRRPLVTNGDCGSLGTVFLLHVICTESNNFSMSFPVSPILRRSTSIRWLSVPPDTISNPLSINASANTEAFFTICFWYSLNSGVNASFKHTAFAAITCIKGPPWIPGKIALLKLYFLFTSSLDKIIPPLGPRSVL